MPLSALLGATSHAHHLFIASKSGAPPHVQTMMLSSTTSIDMYIRIINYDDGPIYCDVTCVRGGGVQIRRIGIAYYARNSYTSADRAEGERKGRLQEFAPKCVRSV